MKKTMSLILSLMLVMTFAAPTYAFKLVTQKSSQVITVDTASDTSQLPTWTGKQLKLTYWLAHGTGEPKHPVSVKDVVSPELKRVTGIVMDKDNSYDNGGMDLSAKLNILVASGDYPDVAYNTDQQKLSQNGKIYDLTKLLPKYAPHIWKTLSKSDPMLIKNGPLYDGKFWGIPIAGDYKRAADLQTGFDPTRYRTIASEEDPMGSLGYITVRDDILKLAYPNAKTQDQIDALYVKNGKFTKSQVLDIPINTRQQAIDFLYKLKDTIAKNNIKEGNKPVYVMASHPNGPTDNFEIIFGISDLMSGLNQTVNYPSYWDKQTKKIEWTQNQSFFKDDIKTYNKMVRDGVISKESLIDSADMYASKLNNGEYAVAYAWYAADQKKLTDAGKKYRYRKVYFNIPMNSKKFMSQQTEPAVYGSISIFKDKVKEADVPQILKYYDLLWSDVGLQLTAWGPKTAGLYKLVNGKRVYTNKDLEDAMIRNVANDKDLYYNLISPARTIQGNGATPAWPPIPVGIQGGGKWNPQYVYDMSAGKRSPGDANNYFKLGFFEQTKKTVVAADANIWNVTNVSPLAKAFWDKRPDFESSLIKCFAAEDDAQFETLYNSYLQTCKQDGATDAALAEMNDKYKTIVNKDFMQNLK